MDQQTSSIPVYGKNALEPLKPTKWEMREQEGPSPLFFFLFLFPQSGHDRGTEQHSGPLFSLAGGAA